MASVPHKPAKNCENLCPPDSMKDIDQDKPSLSTEFSHSMRQHSLQQGDKDIAPFYKRGQKSKVQGGKIGKGRSRAPQGLSSMNARVQILISKYATHKDNLSNSRSDTGESINTGVDKHSEQSTVSTTAEASNQKPTEEEKVGPELNSNRLPSSTENRPKLESTLGDLEVKSNFQ